MSSTDGNLGWITVNDTRRRNHPARNHQPPVREGLRGGVSRCDKVRLLHGPQRSPWRDGTGLRWKEGRRSDDGSRPVREAAKSSSLSSMRRNTRRHIPDNTPPCHLFEHMANTPERAPFTVLKRGQPIVPLFPIALDSPCDFPDLGGERVRSSAARRSAGAWSRVSSPAAKPAPSDSLQGGVRTTGAWRRDKRCDSRARGDEQEEGRVSRAVEESEHVSSAPRLEQTGTGAVSHERPPVRPSKAELKLRRTERRELRVLQERISAARDTHVNLITQRFLRRSRGAPGRRPLAGLPAPDLDCQEEYPSLGELTDASWSSDVTHSYSRSLRQVPRPSLPEPQSADNSTAAAGSKRAAGMSFEFDLSEFLAQKIAAATEPCPIPEDEEGVGLPEEDPTTDHQRDQRRRKPVLLPRRGKTRLEPKPKKPTRLKRLILAERALRRLAGAQGPINPVSCSAGSAPESGEATIDHAPVEDSRSLTESGTSEENGISPGSGTSEDVQVSPIPGKSEEVKIAPLSSAIEVVHVSPGSGISEEVQISPEFSPSKEVQVYPVSVSRDVQVSSESSPSEDVRVTSVLEAAEIGISTDSGNTGEDCSNMDSGITATSVECRDCDGIATLGTEMDRLTLATSNKTDSSGSSDKSETTEVSSASGSPVKSPPSSQRVPTTGEMVQERGESGRSVSASSVEEPDEPVSRGEEYTPRVRIDAKRLLHSNRFRDYCHQILRPEINTTARSLLQDLCRFQERVYLRDPIKAKARRRLVFGLREVNKHLSLDKLKCILIAPDIQNIETEGGLNTIVLSLLSSASQRSVPIVVALKRRALGGVCKKPVSVSCVGILNYQGSEDNFKELMVLTEQAQEEYKVKLEAAERSLQSENTEGTEMSADGKISGTQQKFSPAGRSDRQQQDKPQLPPADPGQQILHKLKQITVS